MTSTEVMEKGAAARMKSRLREGKWLGNVRFFFG